MRPKKSSNDRTIPQAEHYAPPVSSPVVSPAHKNLLRILLRENQDPPGNPVISPVHLLQRFRNGAKRDSVHFPIHKTASGKILREYPLKVNKGYSLIAYCIQRCAV